MRDAIERKRFTDDLFTQRKKTLLIAVVAIVGLFMVIYAISSTIINDSFIKLEAQSTQRNVERVNDAISADLSALDSKTGDWANWDEAYTFVNGENPEFINKNPTDTSFTELNINLMLFINSTGKVVFAKAFDLENETEIPVPESLQEHLFPDDILLKHSTIESDVSGIVLLPEGPMLIVSRPILTGEGKGPISGTLIFGHYLNSIEIKRLSEITHLSVLVQKYNDSRMPSDFIAAQGYLSENKIFIHPLSADSIAGYTILRDVYGNPALIMRVDTPREIYGQGMTSMNYFLFSLLAIGIVFSAAVGLLLNKLILSQSTLQENEKKLKETLNELTRSNEELEQFVHLTAHDLQEPLRMVVCYVQLLEQRYKGRLDPDADEFIGYAAGGAKRMSKMLNDLLTYSSFDKSSGRPALIDCESVLDHALMNLALAIKESGAEITHDPMPNIWADETQLVHVFQNLIENAIKFRGEARPRIHIWVEKKENEWLFSVSDNGIGIDPEYFERIFIISQRLYPKDRYPGTGIGLATCKKIIERHGGRIWVESEPGKGSTFYFTIPVRGDVNETI